MPRYIVLANYTRDALVNIKSAPERLSHFRTLAEQTGITWDGLWLTMGRYDIVAMGDAPDDETMAQFVLSVGMQDIVTTETLRAFSEEDIARIIGRMKF